MRFFVVLIAPAVQFQSFNVSIKLAKLSLQCGDNFNSGESVRMRTQCCFSPLKFLRQVVAVL